MIEKFYKIVYWFFLIESILLLIGIRLDFITYGVDIQTPFMEIYIFSGLVLATIFRLGLNNLNTEAKTGLAVILSFIMSFLCIYYLTEDQFQILIAN